MEFVASAHVAPESHESVGAPLSVVADVERLCVPVVNVVDVAVTFQPVPDPVASLTSIASLLVTVWSRPFRVAEKLTFGGLDANAKLPALIVAVPVVAAAGRMARRPVATTTATATPNRVVEERRGLPPVRSPVTLVPSRGYVSGSPSASVVGGSMVQAAPVV